MGENEELDAFLWCLFVQFDLTRDLNGVRTRVYCQRFSPHPPAPYSPQIRV